MPYEKNALLELHLLPGLRRHFEQHPAFQAHNELPQRLREKLNELDHAEARKNSAKHKA